MRLVDFFAAQVGASLAAREDGASRETAQRIARRAYDIADAMLRERSIRGLGDPDGAFEPEELERVLDPEEVSFYESEELRFFDGGAQGLLDEPAPLDEEEELDPHWQSLADDPELEPKWGPPFSTERRDSDRPGLARTSPLPALDGGLRKKA